jgi:hypothetical protein
MSIGKFISLEEARKQKQLERFAKEHPEKGDRQAFETLLDRMTKGSRPPKRKPRAAKTSPGA